MKRIVLILAFSMLAAFPSAAQEKPKTEAQEKPKADAPKADAPKTAAKAAALPSQLDHRFAVDSRILEFRQWHPERLGHLVAQHQLRAFTDREHKGTDHDEAGKWSAGPDVGQGSQQGLAVELPADFFEGLPDRGVAQIVVGRIEPAAG